MTITVKLIKTISEDISVKDIRNTIKIRAVIETDIFANIEKQKRRKRNVREEKKKKI
jgi:hypothetical protein